MTSKSLFFKLMREDIKRKIWAAGLCFLIFFLSMPVAGAMGITSLNQRYQSWIINGTVFDGGATAETMLARRLSELAIEIIGLQNVAVAGFTVILAVVFALTGFLFLHSKKQMDFYHSIPVRRETIFLVRYLDDILIFTVTCLGNLILAVFVFAVSGIPFSEALQASFFTMAAHLAGFLTTYGLMVMAVILTGNFFISILGSIALFFYIPAVVALSQGLMYLFFATVDTRGINFEDIISYGSPIVYYFNKIVGRGMQLSLDQYGELAGKIIGAILVSLLLAGADLLLYRIRPSESAGKAMAFQKSKTPIKVFLVVPITVFGGVLFWNIYNSIPWAIFGFLFALLISHGIIEIIYHFEFRKLTADPVHILVCGALSLAVIGVFRYDLVGYDRYLPEKDKFSDASLYSYGLKDWNDYGIPIVMEENSYGYSWKYMNGEDYAAENMKITDYEKIRMIAEAGIKNARESKIKKFSDPWDMQQTESTNDYFTSIEVGYRLTNGKKVYRNYKVSVTELRDIFDDIYRNAEYKKGIYPVLSYTDHNLTGIYEAMGGQIRQVTTEPATIGEILLAYQEELTALTLKERAKETPVTSLRFLTLAETAYLNAITQSRTMNYNGTFRIEDMNQVNFFPVYPSFTRTLELIKESGIIIDDEESINQVQRIEIISDYRDMDPMKEIGRAEITREYEGTGLVIENDGTARSEEMIRQVMESSRYSDMVQMNGLQTVEYGFTIREYRKPVGEDKTSSALGYSERLFTSEQIPEFVTTYYHYDRSASNTISVGLDREND